MAGRKTLDDILSAVPAAAPAQQAPAQPPSRVGKKSLQLFLDPSEHKVIKICAAEEEIGIEKLIKIALNEYLAARGKPQVSLS